ncbi:MAG TPA: hypothetical protein VG917_02280 [Patescibacteria group bacterium]|nr:hypothetical protein [Patescibacteria group bacterium]
MSVTDEVAKIVKSIKPIDIKTEIKNPSFAPVINYNSPTNNNYTFQSIEIDNSQLNLIAKHVTNNVIEGIKTQIVKEIKTNPKLQDQLSDLPKKQLVGYLKTTVAGTVTLGEYQPNFLNSGATIYPKLEDIFKLGFETASKGKRVVNNIKIVKNSDNTISIQYEES